MGKHENSIHSLCTRAERRQNEHFPSSVHLRCTLRHLRCIGAAQLQASRRRRVHVSRVRFTTNSLDLHASHVQRCDCDAAALCGHQLLPIASLERWLSGFQVRTRARSRVLAHSKAKPSLAVSVKMNILLYAPGLLALMLIDLGLFATVPRLALCAAVQLVVAVPFFAHPWSYVARAFDFGRRFFYVWSVNWKFVNEETFLSSAFALSLLLLTVSTLLLFALKWHSQARFSPSITPASKQLHILHVYLHAALNALASAC
jgi:hypothetical protein